MISLAKWAVVAAFLSASCFAQLTSFSFTSAPSSKIGLGESRNITPDDGYIFSVSRNFQNGVSFSISNTTHTDWWSLDFASANYTPLEPRFYPFATRYPFNLGLDSHPGLAFSGNGRVDDRLFGEFYVEEASYFEDGSVKSFAAFFRQHDELRLDGLNEGAVRYNAAASASPVPESSTLSLAGAALCVFVAVARRKFRKG